MKKNFALVCLFVLLSVPPAFAADPFDVHKGGFGPKIKGLQLGMPITLMQAKQMMRETFSLSEFVISIYNIHGFSDSKNDLELVYRKTKDGKNVYSLADLGAHESFERYDNDGDIFDEVEKRGYGYTQIYDGVSNGDRDVWITIRHNRVYSFALFNSVFGAESMSFEEFAQALRNAYPLPPLEKGERTYVGSNRSEGWRVRIFDDYDDYYVDAIFIDVIDIPEFN